MVTLLDEHGNLMSPTKGVLRPTMCEQYRHTTLTCLKNL
jgi:hypothetical protein